MFRADEKVQQLRSCLNDGSPKVIWKAVEVSARLAAQMNLPLHITRNKPHCENGGNEKGRMGTSPLRLFGLAHGAILLTVFWNDALQACIFTHFRQKETLFQDRETISLNKTIFPDRETILPLKTQFSRTAKQFHRKRHNFPGPRNNFTEKDTILARKT